MPTLNGKVIAITGASSGIGEATARLLAQRGARRHRCAVRAISEGLRQETDRIRVTVVSPGTVESELADSISDPATREGMRAYRKTVITPDAIAHAILFAIGQPDDVDVSEMIVRPTASPY